MKKIACKLIEYGFDFDYQSKGSNGELMSVHEICVEIKKYQGDVFFNHEGDVQEFKDNEKTFDYLTLKVQQLIIEATSSF